MPDPESTPKSDPKPKWWEGWWAARIKILMASLLALTLFLVGGVIVASLRGTGWRLADDLAPIFVSLAWPAVVLAISTLLIQHPKFGDLVDRLRVAPGGTRFDPPTPAGSGSSTGAAGESERGSEDGAGSGDSTSEEVMPGAYLSAWSLYALTANLTWLRAAPEIAFGKSSGAWIESISGPAKILALDTTQEYGRLRHLLTAASASDSTGTEAETIEVSMRLRDFDQAVRLYASAHSLKASPIPPPPTST